MIAFFFNLYNIQVCKKKDKFHEEEVFISTFNFELSNW